MSNETGADSGTFGDLAERAVEYAAAMALDGTKESKQRRYTATERLKAAAQAFAAGQKLRDMGLSSTQERSNG